MTAAGSALTAIGIIALIIGYLLNKYQQVDGANIGAALLMSVGILVVGIGVIIALIGLIQKR